MSVIGGSLTTEATTETGLHDDSVAPAAVKVGEPAATDHVVEKKAADAAGADGDTFNNDGANGVESADGGNANAEGEEEEEEDALCISVVGDPTKRTPTTDFIHNEGLKAALATATSLSSGEIPTVQFQRCDCTIVHSLLQCSQLHATDEVLRISKTASVRIKSLMQNAGYLRLLDNPKGSNPLCPSTRPDHDKMACKALHLDERCIFMGRQRLGYLPEELLDNQGLRNLKQTPTFTGRWCTNPARHEPRTCLFIHKAPPRGQTAGKRKNANLQKTSSGKVVIATQAVALFTNKKVAGSATVNHSERIPEFAKAHQRDLDRLVAMIDDDEVDDVDASTVSAATAPAPSRSREAKLLGKDEVPTGDISQRASQSRSNNEDTAATLQDSHHAKAKPSKRTNMKELLLSLPPAVVVMLIAVVVALLVPLLPR